MSRIMTAAGHSAMRKIGRFAVSAPRDSVAAFRAALTFGLAPPQAGPDTLPPTYPLRWLNEGALQDAILAELLPVDGSAPALPLHVEQRFDIPTSLAPDTPYWLDVSLTGLDAKRMVRVNAQLADDLGNPLGQMTSTLLMIDTGKAAGT
jgi:hypothetical protein